MKVRSGIQLFMEAGFMGANNLNSYTSIYNENTMYWCTLLFSKFLSRPSLHHRKNKIPCPVMVGFALANGTRAKVTVHQFPA